jgi:hypothetical protein
LLLIQELVALISQVLEVDSASSPRISPARPSKFGEGKVLAIEGAGPDARAQVNFPRHGTKWLALSVAKLTVVD